MKQLIFFLIIVFSFSCCNKTPVGTQQGQQADTDEDKDDDDGDTDEDKEVKKLKDRVQSKKDELEDAEDELDDVEDKLEDIKEELRTNRNLSAAKRKELEDQKKALESQKSTLETRITDLTSQIATLTADLATARTERDTARSERDTARTESACWKKTKHDICDRSQDIRDAIVRKVSGKSACADIHYCDLEKITTLDLSGNYEGPSENARIPCADNTLEFNKNDFKGLINLVELDLSGNCLYTATSDTDLEAEANEGIFTHLPKIRKIKLHDTGVGRLPPRFFHFWEFTDFRGRRSHSHRFYLLQ